MASILLVSHEPAALLLCAKALEAIGFRCITAGNGLEALAQFKQQRFDGIITELRMPVMGGLTLVSNIRASRPGFPAVIITASTRWHEPDEVDALRALHDVVLLEQPITMYRLQSAIRQLIQP